MPVLPGSAVWMTPATSPSVISRTAAPVLRTAAIRSAWRGRSRMQAVISAGLHALGLGEPADVLLGRRVEIDDALRDSPDRWRSCPCRRRARCSSVPPSAMAMRRDRARHVLGAERRAFERIDRDVDLGAVLVADLLADEQHRRLVALALADHHRAVDRQLVELAPHGVDRGLVGGLLVAAAAQPRRRHRRALGHAHDLERQDALQHQVRLDGDRRRHVALVMSSLRRHSVVEPRPRSAQSTDTVSIFLDPDHLRLRPRSPCRALTAASALRTASSVVA